jgi:hypothetical protein
MRSFVTVLLLLLWGGQVGLANPLTPPQNQAVASVSNLTKTLQITEVIEVMRLEGLRYGSDMKQEMFPDKGGAAWTSIVGLIYDGPTMQARFEAAFAKQLAGAEADFPAMERFFGSDLGQRVLKLEVEARRSLMDQAVEDAATARVEDMIAEAEPRVEALKTFSDANDLVEMNISGAMNSNLAFFHGMAEVGGLPDEMTEEDMLMDVWGQEPQIRSETQGWVLPYLALAYGPLSDQELAEYIAFSKTKPGQKLNMALFGAFDAVFTAISRDLGRAAAKQMMGEDI